MLNELNVDSINEYLDGYLDEYFIINLIETWKTISTRIPKGTDSIKDVIVGQIFGGMIRLYCQSNNMLERELKEEDLLSLKTIYENRYVEIEAFLEKMFGRYYSY